MFVVGYGFLSFIFAIWSYVCNELTSQYASWNNNNFTSACKKVNLHDRISNTWNTAYLPLNGPQFTATRTVIVTGIDWYRCYASDTNLVIHMFIHSTWKQFSVILLINDHW